LLQIHKFRTKTTTPYTACYLLGVLFLSLIFIGSCLVSKISVIKISEKGITAMHLNEGKRKAAIKEIKKVGDKIYVFNQLTNWLLSAV